MKLSTFSTPPCHVLGGTKGLGNGVSIFVGGIQEALLFEPRSMKLVLKNRLGFVRLALEHGASLVPCISFCDNELFTRIKFRYIRIQRSFHKELWEVQLAQKKSEEANTIEQSPDSVY